MKKQYDEIDDVKERILNTTLLVGVILGVITFILSLNNYFESELRINYLLNLIVIFGFFIVYYYRSRLSLATKSIVTIIGLFVLSFVDIFKLGPYSPTKILLVLIPFYASISFSSKRIIAFSVVAITIYFCLAYGFISGLIDSTIDLNARGIRLSSWLVNLSLIVIIAWVIITIVNQFNKTFYKLLHDLEEQNKELKAHRENLEGLVAERSKDLESANEELSAINEELQQSQNIIETQNLQLKSTLDYLTETQGKLVQSEKMASLGVLSAGVAHEINNPLNFIVGGLFGLEKFFNARSSEEQDEVCIYLNSIKTGVDRVSNIVSALGQFSRKNESLSEVCDIHTIIENCLVILSHQLDGKINVIKEYNSGSSTVKGNVGKLHQVFTNILSNSIQAIESKGTITVKTSATANYLIAEIQDTGCGISKEDLARVTDPFFSTKDPGMGVGLGLSIVYNIINEHNGEFSIESEVGVGTKVKLKFPVG